MRSVRSRVMATMVVLASVVVGLIATQGSPVGATPLTYGCTGMSTDWAATVPTGFGWTGSGFGTLYSNVSTAGFLNYLQGLVGGLGAVVPTNPQLTADVSTSDVNGSYPQGTQVTRHFTASVALPADLATQASQYLGLSSVALRNSSFTIDGANTSPDHITGAIADQTIPLVAGSSISAPVTGTFTLTGSSGFATYTPGPAHVELLIDPVAFPNGKHISSVLYQGTYIGTDFTVIGLRFDCNPTGGTPTVGYDSITGGSGATTTTLPGATTTTTTQPATTTTQPATTTTTTQPATTTTTTTQPATTTTTQPATTTTQPATTTTQPQSGQHSLSVSVAGAGYTNSGGLTSGGFNVAPGSSVSGTATIPGTNGGSASVTVNVQNFFFWGFGTISVYDPGAGLAPITGYVFFGPPPSGNMTAYGFAFDNTGFHSYTIQVGIT